MDGRQGVVAGFPGEEGKGKIASYRGNWVREIASYRLGIGSGWLISYQGNQ